MPDRGHRAFYDSNALLYLISADAGKADAIAELVQHRGTISVQVLNEFTNVARRKHGLAIGTIRPILNGLREALDVLPLTTEIHDAGLRLIERYRFSTYDAMIVAAALLSQCDTLFSEDMQHGLSVEGKLEIVNPFAST